MGRELIDGDSYKNYYKPTNKFRYVAVIYVILFLLIGLFSATVFSSVTGSLNRVIGKGKDDYMSAIRNVEKMENLVYNQDLLISHYLLNSSDFPPSDIFYAQTKSFNRLYDVEFDYADSLIDISYTYPISLKYSDFIDLCAKLFRYNPSDPDDAQIAYQLYRDEITPKVAAIHTALQNYGDFKRSEMLQAKEFAFNSIQTAFTVFFILLFIGSFLCYFLINRNLKLNLSNVYFVSEEQQKLEKKKSEFISTISHEFKTPLTSIIMGAELLQNNKIGDLNKDQEEILNTITDDGLRLTGLVNNLLEISKIESADTIYAFEEKEVSTIITKALIPYLSIAEKSGINLTFEPVLPIPPAVVDGPKITWVMNNLLSNALKYTNEGDSIVTKISYDTSGFIIVCVQDTGLGIPEEYVENIFERYFRVPDSSVELGGTGLGLAVAKDIITAHGGKIWCTSKPNKGSTFTFTIPAAVDLQS